MPGVLSKKTSGGLLEFGAVVLTEPGGRAGRSSITGLTADYTDDQQDPRGSDLKYLRSMVKLLILNAFTRCRRLRTVGFGEIPRAVVELEVLLLQRGTYDLDLYLSV